MENNEITISEAKRVTAELKASILKLDALNQDVVNNITQLQDLNSKMKDYTSLLSRFEFTDEKEMTLNYASYLSFISKKIDELSKNSSLQKIERIIGISEKIINLSIVKVSLIVAVVVTGINFLISK
ncbi:hypothetical protein CJ673_09325 [Aliarcobacter cryaerophilus]|jgi:hypothetical protein|uniref:Uncharacterized protein n=1 Tax=Aliarcobacter cryaerophilus TaxID=28198 RepID=A0A2S9T4B7_9BACT|nr:hypothetical protein [Aliarcobacter cryaerophilus]MCT7433762.1 hypothetical protein [Aliarcobacter cryaerophilus]PRM93666.1 hypothetical protein CJ673_09325 [Aliarcobacter cryaerophilus]